MCNTYVIRPKCGAQGLAQRVGEATAKLASALVRSDKLEGNMWQEAFHERRCVIPMSLFYEWGPDSGGRKQAHEFRDPEDNYLWAAGIWEENQQLGPCHTMVTTAASNLMSPIHDRMPALGSFKIDSLSLRRSHISGQHDRTDGPLATDRLRWPW
jgi:putative SOS response-associated peptidase YedK